MSGPQTVTPAAYNQICPGSQGCIPQQGTNRLLDTLGDRLMYRFAYRKFATYDAAVVVQTVNAVTSGTKAGVRWYELRNLATGTPFIQQQGTYAPDSRFRWMGSAAMDKQGNIAMGTYVTVVETQLSLLPFPSSIAVDPDGTPTTSHPSQAIPSRAPRSSPPLPSRAASPRTRSTR